LILFHEKSSLIKGFIRKGSAGNSGCKNNRIENLQFFLLDDVIKIKRQLSYL